MDLGSNSNWTITTWPRGTVVESYQDKDDAGGNPTTWKSVYGTVGITGNWMGDDKYLFPHLFGDSINEVGLSCGLLTLVGTKYQKIDPKKTNIFYGVFCQWATGLYSNVRDLNEDLDDVAVWGPNIVGEHFILRDSTGASLVLEFVEGKMNRYLDLNDGQTGYGIMTNEPEFDWHLTNIAHYEWKRTLARQAIEIPGGWYPEQRFLRVYMVKEGMQSGGYDETTDYQLAFSLTAQVLNTVTVPMGNQYGTDTGEASGEGGGADHTIWGMIRDHADAAIYWRDAGNPTFRRLRLKDLPLAEGSPQKSMVLETGPFFVDATSLLH